MRLKSEESGTNGVDDWQDVALSDGRRGYISAKSKVSRVASKAPSPPLPSSTLADEERILVVVPQLNLDGITRTVGDLVFTTRRVFLSRTAGNADLAQPFGRCGSSFSGHEQQTWIQTASGSAS